MSLEESRPVGGDGVPTGVASAAGEGNSTASPDSSGGRVTLEEEVEPWLVAALEALGGSGTVDLDLPLAMHLPILASPRADFITPRQVIGQTAHLGARAYEDFLRANPGSDALKAQAFLVALGADDTPGERREWRRAHLDLMGWLLLALTHEPDLAGALSSVLGEPVLMEAGAEAAITPIRRPVSVPLDRHEAMKKEWGGDQ